MKVGITAGTFDLLHPGHILMLKEAKSLCDILIVAVKVDPTIDVKNKRKPIQSLWERVMQLEACKYVDKVIVYQTEYDFIDILQHKKIDIRIVGDDHRKPKGQESLRDLMCMQKGIEIHYNKRNHRFSSTELIERIKKSR